MNYFDHINMNFENNKQLHEKDTHCKEMTALGRINWFVVKSLSDATIRNTVSFTVRPYNLQAGNSISHVKAV
jgi:hypothetical protein